MRRFGTTTMRTGLPALLLLLSATVTLLAQGTTAPRRTIRKGKGVDQKNVAVVAKESDPLSQRFERDGVVVNFSINSRSGDKEKANSLVAGSNAVVTFRVNDARTNQPITGLHPSAWINARKTAQPPSEAECKDRIRTFVGGLLSARADVDLNSYLLLTLNHDNTITIINPQVSFSVTKLESIVALPGPGADWTLSQNKEFLYVTLPEQAGVAVISTALRKLVATIATGQRTRPVRIALQPDGRYAWVGLDNSPLVAVIDTKSNRLAATIPAGAGLHNIAFNADSSLAFVTNSAADTVSIIDAKKLAKLADVAVGQTPVPVAYSRASRLVYVATLNGSTVAAIDPARRSVVATTPVKKGVVALRFEPTGRFAFLVNQLESKVSVLDASTNALVGETSVVKEPDQVTFTGAYAYVRGLGSEKFSLIETGGLAQGKLAAVDVVAGRQSPGAQPEDIGVADMIAPTPEGNAAMIANAPDQMIYYYVEGMMAPMGTFSNYKRRPRALLLLDRSLTEVAPGVYSTAVKIARAGRFDVPMMIDQPRLFNCFQLEVGESPDGLKNEGVSIALEALFREQRFKPQEATSLRFKITDPATHRPVTGLRDVQVLVFEPPGVWQERQFAKELGDGVYEIKQNFPREGLYNVMVRVSSRGTSYADLPRTFVKVMNNPQPDNQKKPVERKEAKNE